MSYWDFVDPYWERINIYDGPEIFLATFQAAPLMAALLFAAHFTESEICNGGFHQFFWNSTGVLAPEAVCGFQAIGQDGVAHVIESAMSRFGPEYPRDRPRRQSILKTLGKKAFDDLDDRFFDLIDTESGGFESAADEYAANK